MSSKQPWVHFATTCALPSMMNASVGGGGAFADIFPSSDTAMQAF